MKKVIFLVSVFFVQMVSSQQFSGQVGINTPQPNASAALDVYSSNKALMVPRLTSQSSVNPVPTADSAGLVIYNQNQKCLQYFDGTNWVCISGNAVRMFYMPSVSFDTSRNATGQRKDLYTLYKNQFGTPQSKSTSAPASIPFFPKNSDLYYYVTYADPNVFKNISISDAGVMTYDVTAAATDCTYINIVFVVK